MFYFDTILGHDIKMKCRSFKDILDNIYLNIKSYIKDIDIQQLQLTKDYNLIKKSNYKTHIKKVDDVICYKSINTNYSIVSKTHYSKQLNSLVDKDTKEKLQFGEYIHYLLEMIDFKKPDLSFIDDKYEKYILSFLNSGIDFITPKIYKEYEFATESSHGIIDLLLEYQDKIIIIDYKLKNVYDDAYILQLNGYKDYISTKLNKKIELYLYSILDQKLKQL